ncbi:two-component sensor histidine kinase [Novosphingobium sp. FSY-8]|uniref:histidine kinase n=1 Tax=Novosphingobium ovatum TaxID=1908523 RepID=A0ABW9XDQ3_9SPHN|nr:ATP-binding protein [Novosphingobium ovatum]NBC36673.1 two-component sensor histidine kinase [Novosphingobium ovatum]
MMGSLQWRLSVALALLIVLVGLLGGVYAYRAAYHEAEELQDGTLRQIAVLVARQDQGAGARAATGRPTDAEDAPQLVISRYDGAPDAILPLPAGLPLGLGTYDVAGLSYRVLIASDNHGRRFALAQRASFRDEIARDSARQCLLPLGLLVPALLLLVPGVIRYSFRPVDRAARDLAARSAKDIHPIAAGDLPAEVQPFVQAIDALLARVSQSVEQQRRFIADAAHELRSPMAALSLQAERLAQCDLSPEAESRLSAMTGGIARNQRLLEQLLDLARAQSGPSAATGGPLAMADVLREVIEEAMPLALAKGVDLGVSGAADGHVEMNRIDMLVALRNLVHNAIRHSPKGGAVDMHFALIDGGWTIAVTDQGGGMGPDDIARATMPFYRVAGTQGAGSGLGLAIVSAIADRAGLELRLTNRAEGGFCAALTASCP